MEPRAGEPAAENVRWLLEQWTTALVSAIESMTEVRPDIQWAEPAAEGENAKLLCWEQGFSEIPGPALWITAPETTWADLGGRTLRAAGIEAPEPADARNTYLEILSQSLGSVAQSLGARLGKEVVCERGTERPQPGPAAHRASVTLGYPEGPLGMEIAFHPGLLAALDRGIEDRLAPAPGETGAAPASAAPGAVPPSPKNIDLLLDVELPVSVSFGRAQLPIKDVLKLTTGSIVELNRSVNEPVEILVNGWVVARGEVVVVEGNYGVRIQHIMSRQDRLRSLK